jgi:hypothetical protein
MKTDRRTFIKAGLSMTAAATLWGCHHAKVDQLSILRNDDDKPRGDEQDERGMTVTPIHSPCQIIDAHTHPYGRDAEGSLVWDPSSLIGVLPENGISLTLSSIRGPLTDQYQWMSDLCRKHPWILPLVWFSPGRDKAEEVGNLLNQGFIGIKTHPSRDKFEVDGDVMTPFMQLAEQRKIPIQIHCAADSFCHSGKIANLARKFPSVKIVMVHSELGSRDKTGVIANCRGLQNVIFETSWVGPEAVLHILSSVEKDRVIFGTDATTDQWEHFQKRSLPDAAGNYIYTIPDMIAKVRAAVTPDIYAAWTRLAVLKLYRLQLLNS